MIMSEQQGREAKFFIENLEEAKKELQKELPDFKYFEILCKNLIRRIFEYGYI